MFPFDDVIMFTGSLPGICVQGMTSRANFCVARDYLTPSRCSLIKCVAMGIDVISHRISTQSCYNTYTYPKTGLSYRLSKRGCLCLTSHITRLNSINNKHDSELISWLGIAYTNDILSCDVSLWGCQWISIVDYSCLDVGMPCVIHHISSYLQPRSE